MGLYQQLALYYDQLFPVTKDKIEWIEDKLKLQPRNKVLDLGCGTGDYVISFSQKDYCAYGIDNDQNMIEMAINKLQQHAIMDSRVAVGDMMEAYPFKEKFEAIFCIGNTLPHSNDFDEVLQCLQVAKDHLVDKGRILIQTVNFDQPDIENKKFPVLTANNGQIKFYRNYCPHDYNDCKLYFDTTLEAPDSGERYQHRIELLLLNKNKLLELIKKAGFEVINSYCGFTDTSWERNCQATVLVAEST